MSLLEIARLVQPETTTQNGVVKPERYNIYQLIHHPQMLGKSYGVVTRNGRFDENGDPKMALISGKFHETEEDARQAYTKLVSNMRQRGGVEGTYSFSPKTNNEWEALSLSVEKRQAALERRRQKKRSGEDRDVDEKTRVGDEEVVDNAVEEKVQNEEPPKKKKPRKSRKKIPAEKKTEEAEEEVVEVVEDKGVVIDKDQEEDDKKPQKKKRGRQSKVPENFTEGQEAWNDMDTKSRKAWKKANPIE